MSETRRSSPMFTKVGTTQCTCLRGKVCDFTSLSSFKLSSQLTWKHQGLRLIGRKQCSTLPLERLGNEKIRVETGAAIRVSNKDPTNRPGRFDNPREIAPSSRSGSTTKYALKICQLRGPKSRSKLLHGHVSGIRSMDGLRWELSLRRRSRKKRGWGRRPRAGVQWRTRIRSHASETCSSSPCYQVALFLFPASVSYCPWEAWMEDEMANSDCSRWRPSSGGVCRRRRGRA